MLRIHVEGTVRGVGILTPVGDVGRRRRRLLKSSLRLSRPWAETSAKKPRALLEEIENGMGAAGNHHSVNVSKYPSDLPPASIPQKKKEEGVSVTDFTRGPHIDTQGRINESSSITPRGTKGILEWSQGQHHEKTAFDDKQGERKAIQKILAASRRTLETKPSMFGQVLTSETQRTSSEGESCPARASSAGAARDARWDCGRRGPAYRRWSPLLALPPSPRATNASGVALPHRRYPPHWIYAPRVPHILSANAALAQWGGAALSFLAIILSRPGLYLRHGIESQSTKPLPFGKQRASTSLRPHHPPRPCPTNTSPHKRTRRPPLADPECATVRRPAALAPRQRGYAKRQQEAQQHGLRPPPAPAIMERAQDMPGTPLRPPAQRNERPPLRSPRGRHVHDARYREGREFPKLGPCRPRHGVAERVARALPHEVKAAHLLENLERGENGAHPQDGNPRPNSQPWFLQARSRGRLFVGSDRSLLARPRGVKSEVMTNAEGKSLSVSWITRVWCAPPRRAGILRHAAEVHDAALAIDERDRVPLPGCSEHVERIRRADAECKGVAWGATGTRRTRNLAGIERPECDGGWTGDADTRTTSDTAAPQHGAVKASMARLGAARIVSISNRDDEADQKTAAGKPKLANLQVANLTVIHQQSNPRTERFFGAS
ncbi:hypothetical protein C8R47DRAFT_1083427 [Mycena vitilis]|nr:hypothetical protein C8R47DRAFT_1083427 [Mycena vitilis]